MPTSEERLTTVEKDIATLKHDIIYKLDDTNSAVTIIKGVMGALAQDTKIIRSQIKTMDLRLDGIDTRLARVEESQNEQGQDTRDIKRRFDSLENKFDQMLVMLTTLTNKP